MRRSIPLRLVMALLIASFIAMSWRYYEGKEGNQILVANGDLPRNLHEASSELLGPQGADVAQVVTISGGEPFSLKLASVVAAADAGLPFEFNAAGFADLRVVLKPLPLFGDQFQFSIAPRHRLYLLPDSRL